jgi:hypothetical protein
MDKPSKGNVSKFLFFPSFFDIAMTVKLAKRYVTFPLFIHCCTLYDKNVCGFCSRFFTTPIVCREIFPGFSSRY